MGVSAKVLRVFKWYLKIRDKVLFEKCLKGKEKMLKQLYEGIKVMSEEYGINSLEVSLLNGALSTIYAMTGNTNRIQSRFVRK